MKNTKKTAQSLGFSGDDCPNSAAGFVQPNLNGADYVWDESWKHDWSTWRVMLPKYVQEMLVTLE